MRGDRGESLGGVLALLASLVATSVVAGLIGAGLLMPAIGATGAVARGGVDFFDSLPAEYQASPLAQQSRILAADGSVIATFYSENRIVVPLSKIAPVMQKAQVAIEDDRFYEHGGVDLKGIVRAAVNNASSDDTQGASTLTQQFVKLTLQENALYAGDEEAAKNAVRKSMARKIQEAKYAVALEQKLTKAQILEGYLNIAYYGDGVYGVEAAARHYFSTTAAKLTLPQAAMLAGIVQSPTYYEPTSNAKAAVGRRNVVLKRMLDTGAITQAEHDQAVKTKLALKVRKTGNGCDSSKYAFFCEYVYRTILNDKAFGASQDERAQLVKRGGLTVRTTLDPDVQKDAQKAVHERVPAKNKPDVASAISVVEPGTGKVLAMAQSKPFGRDKKKGQTSVNLNVDQMYGGGSGFQTGSTFKAVTLAAALEDGKSLRSIVVAPRGGTVFHREDFKPGNCTDLRRDYPPYNAERNESGPMTLLHATADSVNTAFVQLESEIGICDVADMAGRLGIHLAAPTDQDQPGGRPSTKLRPYGSLTLGTEPVAPLTMAAAYATFAADGKYCAPMPITSVTTRDGKLKKTIKPTCEKAMDENIARGVSVALQSVITSGTGRGAAIGRPAAGKTGTTNGSKDVWFAGYTPQMAAAVWVGHQDTVVPLKNFTLNGRSYGTVYGATIPAPIWADFMRSALKGEPVEQFGQTSDKVLNGDRVTVPHILGGSVDAAKAALSSVGLGATVSDAGVPSDLPAGTVAASTPREGQRVIAGTTVTLYLSTGPQQQQPPPTTGTGGAGPGQGGGQGPGHGPGQGGDKRPKHPRH
jgi:membrane peptidoglycan carboxypeptidase